MRQFFTNKKFLSLAGLLILVVIVVLLAPAKPSIEPLELELGDITAVPTAFAAHETPRLVLDLPEVAPEVVAVFGSDDLAVLDAQQRDKTDNFSVELLPGQREKLELRLNPKKGTFRPGRYTVSGQIATAEGIRDFSQDFYWGVLALNTHKSVYRPGEEAYIQLAVLDDQGDTICDAELELKIQDTSSKIQTLSTVDGSIVKNPACGPNNVIETPDYYTYYELSEPGFYQLELTALTPNGLRTIKDFIEVKTDVPFEVERVGPTRIYPLVDYEMSLKIKAKSDFTGVVREVVPGSFEIRNSKFEAQNKFEIQNLNEQKILEWPVEMRAGESIELAYTFDAPDVSPEFYLLGPLRLVDAHSGQATFEEARQWQIASDAILEFYETSDFTGASCEGTCPTAFTTFLTLTVDRTSEAVAKDFLIIASVQLEVNSTAADEEMGAQMTIGGTAVSDMGNATTNRLETTTPGSHSDNAGLSFGVIATTTIGVASSVDIDLDWKMETAGDATTWRDASIMALEIPAGTFQAAKPEAASSSGANETHLRLNFTPSATDNYLVMGYYEGYSEDWNDSTSPFFGVHVDVAEAATTTSINIDGNDIWNDSTNNSDYFPMPFWFVQQFDNTAHTIDINMLGSSAADEAFVQNSRILAIPLGNDFTYHYVSDKTKTFISSASLTQILAFSPTIIEGPHIILFSTEVGNEDGNDEASYPAFGANGANIVVGPQYEFDEDDTEKISIFGAHATSSMTSGTKTFSMFGRTSQSGGADDATFERNQILVLRVPYPPAPSVAGGTGTMHIKSGTIKIKSGTLKINLLNFSPLLISWTAVPSSRRRRFMSV